MMVMTVIIVGVYMNNGQTVATKIVGRGELSTILKTNQFLVYTIDV